MTFDEYNTDEYFNNKDSTADGLIKAAYDEGKTREEVEKSLSPLWKEDKKGNVKKALDTYYKTEEPKAEEQKPTEEKVLEKVIEQTAETPKQTSNLKGSVKKYADKETAIADEAQRVMDGEIKDNVSKNWRELMDSENRRAEGYKRIDDHMIDQLPTFIFSRYQNGEFGDISDTSTPEGKQSKKNAQLRLAHFMINGLGTALSNMSHTIRKDGVQEESDYENYQRSNLEQGMQNRWAKYKADTDGAIKAVEKEFGNEQDARLAAEQFTRDKKANLYWNMMDQDQKVYAMEVSKAIGDMLGGMDIKEIASFIAGSALNGNLTKDELIGVGVAQLVSKSPELLDKFPGVKDFLSSMFGTGILTDIAGGGEGGVINNVVNAVTDKDNTYKEEGTKKGNVTDKLLGLGNVNMSDKTMDSYYALSERKPEGITTDLPTKDIILKTMSDYPDKGLVGIIDKSGTTKAINKQFSEIDNLASQATKEFKKDGNLKKYQNRMKELYDYRNELQAVFKNFGKAPIPGNSIQSDYDKAFSNKEANFRKKYSK